MKVRWTEAAVTDLEEIGSYIAADKPVAALRTIRTIYKRILQLGSFPMRGRPGKEAGTRELVLTPLPYVVVYRVVNSAVEILHINHGATIH